MVIILTLLNIIFNLVQHARFLFLLPAALQSWLYLMAASK